MSNFYLFDLTRTLIKSVQENNFCGTGRQKELSPLATQMREILMFLQLFHEINIPILSIFKLHHCLLLSKNAKLLLEPY